MDLYISNVFGKINYVKRKCSELFCKNVLYYYMQQPYVPYGI